jgi:hypothetical protein
VTRSPIAPQVLRAGLVLVDPGTGRPGRVIALQYNPESLTRTLQPKGMGEDRDRSSALRLRGPAVETLRIEASLDAADFLAQPLEHPTVVREGLGPVLSLFEQLVNPTSRQLVDNDRRADDGTLEIIPMETPLPVFVWSANRVVPVRITELAVTEEAFDTRLNPIRARVTLGMRVLGVDDVGFRHPAGALQIASLRARERLAALAERAPIASLGLERLP